MKKNGKIVLCLLIFVFVIAGYLVAKSRGIQQEKVSGNTEKVESVSGDALVLSEVPEEAKVTGLPQITNMPKQKEKSEKSSPTKAPAKETEKPFSTKTSEKREKGTKQKSHKESKNKSSSNLKKEENPAQTVEKTSPQTDDAKATEIPKSTEPPCQTVHLSIDCKSVLKHLDSLSEGKKSIIPKNGVFIDQKISLQKDDTVYSVFLRACKDAGILTDVDTSFSGYIKGIGNLYEKDVSPSSGWLYSVNGKYPNVGVKGYKLSANDDIQITYSSVKGDVISG